MKSRTLENQQISERENELLAKQLELEEKRLKIEEMKKETANDGTTHQSKPFGKIPKLPSFNEGKDNIDAYLLRFERYAAQQKWPKTEWAVYRGALLTGKGLEVYYSLENEHANDYEKLRAVLNRYELNEEGFRKQFKRSRPEQGESGPAYATRIRNYFMRWLDLSSAPNTYEGLLDLLVRDQFIHSIPQNTATFIRERKPNNTEVMINLADQYIEAHGGCTGTANTIRVNRPFIAKKPMSQHPGNESKPSMPIASTGLLHKRGACFICNRMGHARDCSRRYTANRTSALCETPEGERRLDTFLSSMLDKPGKEKVRSEDSTTDCNDKAAVMMVATGRPEVVPSRGVFKLDCGHELTVITASACNPSNNSKLHIVDGYGYVESTKVKALRDTGCNGVFVKKSLVKPEQRTGGFKTCILIDVTVRQFPTAIVHIDTPYWTGKVTAKCMEKPVYDLIFGQLEGMRDANDPKPVWKGTPTTDGDVIVDGDETVGAVQTRSQAKVSTKPFKPLIVPAALWKIREDADVYNTKACRGKNGGTYSFVKEKSILYREFKAPNYNYDERVKQVVVPQPFRKRVMKVAHETILGGNQTAKRTQDRIISSFYWLGMGADVRRYCQSCDTCQRNIPKGRVTKVPLRETPIIDTPFERIAVDVNGPMKPTTDRGHRYILVLIDYASLILHQKLSPQV